MANLLPIMLVIALSLTACREDALDEPADEQTESAGFFDEASLFDGAVDLAEESAPVDCVGASEQERERLDHPRLLRGRLLAPDGRLATRATPDRDLLDTDLPWWQRLVPTAYAAPLEGESVVADVTVALVRVDERGEPEGPPLVETTTNLFGQWCLRMPDDVLFGPTLMLIAHRDRHRLRRPVLHGQDLDIYSQPEALVRLLIDEGFLLTELDVDTYLNLDVMAQTAVDLLDPVTVRPDAGVDSLLARLEQGLRQDRRLVAALERVRSARQEQSPEP